MPTRPNVRLAGARGIGDLSCYNGEMHRVAVRAAQLLPQAAAGALTNAGRVTSLLPRIHASTALQPGASLTLDGEQSHYLVRVLRLRAGAPVQVCDGRGARAQATLTQADAGRAQVLIGRVDARPTGSGVESPLHITLAQCLSSADKMDWTIEKACELGVAAIVPVSRNGP